MKRSLLSVALICACAMMMPAGTALAEPGGYGPSAPTGPAGTPGGFTEVVTTKTVDAAGGAVTGAVAGASLSADVPQGAFSVPVQVEVTNPKLDQVAAALPAVGYTGYKAVAGLGFKVLDAGGAPMTGTFAKPIDITLTGANLGMPGEKVLQFEGPASASAVDATVGDGSITLHLTQDPNLIVVNPPAGSATGSTGSAGTEADPAPTLAGATTTHTGKPFAAETLMGASFVAAGLGLGTLVLYRRRRLARA